MPLTEIELADAIRDATVGGRRDRQRAMEAVLADLRYHRDRRLDALADAARARSEAAQLRSVLELCGRGSA